MIPKLRRKFILIIMSLISSILIIVFAGILFANYNRQANEIQDVLSKTISRDFGSLPPSVNIGDKKDKGKKPNLMIPIFTVQLDSSNQILYTTKENVNVAEETVSELVNRIVEKDLVIHAPTGDKQYGLLLSEELAYTYMKNDAGVRIAIADISRNVNETRNMALTLLLLAVLGLGAFLLVSIYLATWALRPVEKAWKQQEQFVADASHELRTPLTVILANVGILLSHKKDRIEDQLRWVENTHAEATRMKKLVDDLLFLAKSDEAQETITPMPVNMSDLLWNSVLPFESVAFENGVTLESDIQPDLHTLGNEGQLRQLAIILIDNACKYAGPDGVVDLLLKAEHDQLRLVINNTGALIPEEHLKHIFERFYRSESSRAREYGGYGLGLAIAKTIVDHHKGTIHAESREGHGTTFMLTLPLIKKDLP